MLLIRFLPRAFACACLALLASSALADGKAFTLPEKAKVEMADQRALIAFDGKQETLVIDTRIKPVDAAAGATPGKQSYAWVVPLPAVPTKVEAGTVGMFDTLRELTRPELVNRVDVEWTGWAVAVFALTVLITAIVSFPTRWLAILAGGLFLFCFLGIFVPVLGVATKSANMPMVDVHLNETIGSYDTAVLTSPDGAALTAWLESKGYPMPADTAPMVAQLSKEGWCFAAMKLHETSGGFAHPHPMGFVFPATKAIYPMRLTGIGQVAPLTVDLFVCGAQEAAAEGFHAGCAVGTTQEGPAEHADEGRLGPWNQGVDPVPTVHPGLRRFVPEARVLTWLRGAVPAAAMGRDVEIRWRPHSPHRDVFYSKKGAEQLAWKNAAGAFFLVMTVAVVGAGIMIRLKRTGAAIMVVVLGVCFALAAGKTTSWAIYRRCQQVEVERGQEGKWSWFSLRGLIAAIPECLNQVRLKAEVDKPITADWVRNALREGMDSDVMREKFWASSEWRNYFHEGDSPNQFSIREENGSAKVYFYNAVGQEFQIWPEPAEKK